VRHRHCIYDEQHEADLAEHAPFEGWEGWKKGFDKEHGFNETKPPKSLLPLRHGFEYLIYDIRDKRMCVTYWNSSTGWEDDCYHAGPYQLIHCLPEVPDNPEEIK
jgi:hypothetical protein